MLEDGASSCQESFCCGAVAVCDECTSAAAAPAQLAPALAEVITLSLQQGVPEYLSVSTAGPALPPFGRCSRTQLDGDCGGERPCKRRTVAEACCKEDTPAQVHIVSLNKVMFYYNVLYVLTLYSTSSCNDGVCVHAHAHMLVSSPPPVILRVGTQLFMRRLSEPSLSPLPHAHLQQQYGDCSLASCEDMHGTACAAQRCNARRHRLTPLRLDFNSLQPPQPQPRPVSERGDATAAPAAAASTHTTPPLTPSEWIDYMEAQLSSRGRRQPAAALSSIGGDSSSGHNGAGGSGIDAALPAGEQSELVPPAFVLLGQLSSNCQ